MKAALAEASIQSRKPYDYSISLGMNHFFVEADIDLTDVIEQADTMMYKDKASYRRHRRS